MDLESNDELEKDEHEHERLQNLRTHGLGNMLPESRATAQFNHLRIAALEVETQLT